MNLAPGPDAAREERTEQGGQRLDRRGDRGGREGGGDGLSDLLPLEGLLFGLHGQVADSPARHGQRPLHARRCSRRDQEIEAARVEIGLSPARVAGLEERDPSRAWRRSPVRRIGVERDAAGADLAHGIGSRPDPPHGARARMGDGKDGMREHGKERGVGQEQIDLHRALIGGEDLLHDPRRAPEEARAGRVWRRRQRVGGHDDPVEALGDVARGERGAVVEANAVTDAEGPLEAVSGDRPRSCQSRFHVARALAVLNESLEDLARDQRDRTVEGGGRIQDGGNGRQADSEEGTLSSRGDGRRQGGHHRYESADPPRHGVFISKRRPGCALARQLVSVVSTGRRDRAPASGS